MNMKFIESAASFAMKKFEGTTTDIKAFILVMEFIEQMPGSLSWRGSTKPDFDNLELYISLADKFFKARYTLEGFKAPRTEPDVMVGYILEVYFNYTDQEAEKIKVEHQLSMAAENMVGALLERYIGLALEEHGWAWCSGNFVKAIDMIKKNDDGTWVLLQVKNRNNTENSSSSAIRAGTTIVKWFRSFSNKSLTNWAAFPDESARCILSEQGFKEFVRDYLLRAKHIKK